MSKKYDLAARHTTLSKKVVTISADGRNRDATVVVSGTNSTYLIASDRFLDPGRNNIVVKFPNKDLLASKYFRTNNGLLGIYCTHPSQQLAVEGINFYDGVLAKQQLVYTYSAGSDHKALTPGYVTSLSVGSFNHDCAAHSCTIFGSPVIDDYDRFVGMCYDFSVCTRAYDSKTIASKICENHGQRFTGVKDTIQFLQSFCG